MPHNLGYGPLTYLIHLLAQGQYFLNLHMPLFSTDAPKINFMSKDLTLNFNAFNLTYKAHEVLILIRPLSWYVHKIPHISCDVGCDHLLPPLITRSYFG